MVYGTDVIKTRRLEFSFTCDKLIKIKHQFADFKYLHILLGERKSTGSGGKYSEKKQ